MSEQRCVSVEHSSSSELSKPEQYDIRQTHDYETNFNISSTKVRPIQAPPSFTSKVSSCCHSFYSDKGKRNIKEKRLMGRGELFRLFNETDKPARLVSIKTKLQAVALWAAVSRAGGMWGSPGDSPTRLTQSPEGTSKFSLFINSSSEPVSQLLEIQTASQTPSDMSVHTQQVSHSGRFGNKQAFAHMNQRRVWAE